MPELLVAFLQAQLIQQVIKLLMGHNFIVFKMVYKIKLTLII